MQHLIKNKLLYNVAYSIEAKRRLIEDSTAVEQFSKSVEQVIKTYELGGRLYIAGNGGSAADSQHLAAEFVSKLAKLRGPLPAEALTVDSSILTAIANDFGYEEVFSRQLEGKATSKDIFLGLTTSGSSKNIVLALKTCRKIGITSIIFTGNMDGECHKHADYCIKVPSKSTATIQEVHTVLYHTLCELVESHFFP